MREPNASAGGGFHEVLSEVRYGETDQMGYAHHAVAVSWFEYGRVVFMRDHGFAYGRLETQGILMPVVRLSLHYHAPARFEDPLAIQTRLIELGRSRVVFQNRVLRAEAAAPGARVLLVEGQVDLACVDRAGRVQRLPDDLRAAFESLVRAGARAS